MTTPYVFRWVDEDDCEDTEAPPPIPVSSEPTVVESSESAKSERSPLVDSGEAERELFQGLKIEEKMVLFATMWNHSRSNAVPFIAAIIL